MSLVKRVTSVSSRANHRIFPVGESGRHAIRSSSPMPDQETRPTQAGAKSGEESSLETIRIVLADDHAVVRSGLRLLLDGESGLEVVAEAGDVDARDGTCAATAPTCSCSI